MKPSALRQKTNEDLRETLAKLQQERFKVRMLHYTGQLDNMARLGQMRREIAQILTILRERELTAGQA